MAKQLKFNHGVNVALVYARVPDDMSMDEALEWTVDVAKQAGIEDLVSLAKMENGIAVWARDPHMDMEAVAHILNKEEVND